MGFMVMKKRIKNKKKKEFGIIYKNQSIVFNSPYSIKEFKAVLFYCPKEGVEIYFKSIGKAKRYLDSIGFIKKDLNNIPF